MLLPGCAGGPRPVSGGFPAGDGVRVLFRVESEGPRGRERFRMAAALRPPQGVRLEFLGPVGGTRLVVATDGAHAVAILPSERQFDTTAGTADSMGRLLGLPLDGESLIALLSGDGGEAVVGARTVIVFTGAEGALDGWPQGATLRDPASGATIAEVRYGDRPPSPGGRWPRHITVELSEGWVVSLTAVEGPAAARLPDELFAPTIPDGFARSPIFRRVPDPALFGPGQERGP